MNIRHSMRQRLLVGTIIGGSVLAMAGSALAQTAPSPDVVVQSEADQDATAACSTPVKTNVDWATIDDEKLQSLSIGSFCGVVASELESMCRNTPAFKSTAPGLGLVQCKFAPQLKIRVENQQVLFSTEKDAPNQEEFVRQFLRNL